MPFLFATGPGSEVQRPLAIVVIGGLITSTLLTLIVLPTLYRWFDEKTDGNLPEGAIKEEKSSESEGKQQKIAGSAEQVLPETS